MALVKAKLLNVSVHGDDMNEAVEVMFNPTQYSISKNMNYADVNIPGLQMPLLQFVRGDSRVLSVELFLDNSDSGAPLEDELNKLREFVEINNELHAPPVCKFIWGGGTGAGGAAAGVAGAVAGAAAGVAAGAAGAAAGAAAAVAAGASTAAAASVGAGRDRDFQGVMTEFTETFQMFNDQGDVIRARVKISIKSYKTAEEQYRDLNRQSPDRTKTRVIKQGDRLDLIASEEYGDPGEWRTLAAANNIVRPRLLIPGDILIVPPL